MTNFYRVSYCNDSFTIVASPMTLAEMRNYIEENDFILLTYKSVDADLIVNTNSIVRIETYIEKQERYRGYNADSRY